MPDPILPAVAAAPNPFAAAAQHPFGSPSPLHDAPSWYDIDPNSPLSSPRSTGTLPDGGRSSPLQLRPPHARQNSSNVERLQRLSPAQLGVFITVYVVMAARLEDWSLLRRMGRDIWQSTVQRSGDSKWVSPASIAARIGIMLDAVEGAD